MKKILLGLVLMSLLVGLVVPMLAFAQAPTQCNMRRDPDSILGGNCPAPPGTADFDVDYGGVRGAMCCLFSTILYVVDWLFMALMIVVVILILFGAFTLVTASGSEDGVKRGRDYIIFALIGVAVALLARALPYLIRSIMGM